MVLTRILSNNNCNLLHSTKRTQKKKKRLESPKTPIWMTHIEPFFHSTSLNPHLQSTTFLLPRVISNIQFSVDHLHANFNLLCPSHIPNITSSTKSHHFFFFLQTIITIQNLHSLSRVIIISNNCSTNHLKIELYYWILKTTFSSFLLFLIQIYGPN